MNVKFFVMIFFFFLAITVKAEKAEKILNEIRSNYDQLSSFKIDFEYKLFKGIKGDNLHEHYSSQYMSANKNAYRRLGQNEFISTDQALITIDNESNEIFISDPQEMKVSQFDEELIVKHCKDIKVFKKEDGNIELQFLIKPGSGVEFSRIDIVTDESRWIKKMVLFYNSRMNFSGSSFSKELDYPRLEIIYKSFKKKWKDKEGITDFSKYLNENNKNVQGKGEYAHYTITDYRTKNN